MDEHLLEVYLINTARHTEETPVAEWVSLPTDAETMKAVFERLGVDGSDTEQYQVSAFHSSLDGWSEALKPGESLDDLNYLAALLTQRSDEERDKFAAAVLFGDHAASAADLINLTHNLDCYWLYPTVHNSDDYGHYLIDDLDELELPDAAKRFFDYKSYGREAVKEDRGIFTDYGYVYNNGNDYAEWYKANQVPQEYRLTAQPSPQRDMDELPQGAALPVEPIPVRPLVLNATDTQGRIKEITEHLEQGVQVVFESERYRDYLKAMSRFHNYSLNNTLLIVMQKPDASLIAGYGYHHSTDDGKYLIMGNGTQAFAIAAEQREQENYMRTAELSTEQNYNMIDGQINNIPSVDELEEKAKRGEVISLSALAAAVKAEDGRTPQRDPDGKKPSIRAQLKADRAQSCKPQQREKEQEAKRSIRQALEME